MPRVIENMRNTILSCGGEVHFQTRMDALIIKNNQVIGIETNTGKTFHGPVILATGHSARDVYRWLYSNNIPLESKGIAVGVRLEHPSMLIDQIQYHNKTEGENICPQPNIALCSRLTDEEFTVSVCVREDLLFRRPAVLTN